MPGPRPSSQLRQYTNQKTGLEERSRYFSKVEYFKTVPVQKSSNHA